MDMSEIVTVSIACASEEEAQALALALVEAKLAACAQTTGIRSTYRWRGAVEQAPEVLLTLKTLTAKLPELEARVKARHSYDTPELVATPVVWASADYAAWLRESLI
jgi:uncharacterized protein involved in tolerance to divalent cations